MASRPLDALPARAQVIEFIRPNKEKDKNDQPKKEDATKGVEEAANEEGEGVASKVEVKGAETAQHKQIARERFFLRAQDLVDMELAADADTALAELTRFAGLPGSDVNQKAGTGEFRVTATSPAVQLHVHLLAVKYLKEHPDATSVPRSELRLAHVDRLCGVETALRGLWEFPSNKNTRGHWIPRFETADLDNPKVVRDKLGGPAFLRHARASIFYGHLARDFGDWAAAATCSDDTDDDAPNVTPLRQFATKRARDEGAAGRSKSNRAERSLTGCQSSVADTLRCIWPMLLPV